LALTETLLVSAKVLNVLAQGGFGRVERVQLDDGTIAARKVFAPTESALVGVTAEQLRKRFTREVKIQSEIPNRFFLPVLDADLEADPPWFLMPLADTTLEHRMPALKADREELITALDQVLEALEKLHELGFAHRDLKPQNILYHDGRWKLADLGLALPITTESTKLTASRQGWFSIRYCAPEQYKDFRNAKQPADIYAFGCILHDFFGDADRMPCQRATAAGRIGAVIEKSTEVDQNRRFKSLDGLRGALFDVLATPPEPRAETALTEEATEWAEKLADLTAMAPGDIESLARFLRGLADRGDASAVFAALTEERLALLKQRDPDLWPEIASEYCEWARGGSFQFQYCDVIARRLLTIYRNGSVEIQANAALAGACIGESHNRWYVMGRVLEMCGPKIEANVAERIAIEIRAGELQREFRRCAAGIGQELSAYHPLIAAVLSEAQKRPEAPLVDDDVPF
jgi:eukaryotic-like serine/threonine-protein kinase